MKLTLRLDVTIEHTQFEEYTNAIEPILKKYGGCILVTDEKDEIVGSPYVYNPKSGGP